MGVGLKDFFLGIGTWLKNTGYPALKSLGSAIWSAIKSLGLFFGRDMWVGLYNFSKNTLLPALKSLGSAIWSVIKSLGLFFGRDMWVYLWTALKKTFSWIINTGSWAIEGCKKGFHYCKRNGFGKYSMKRCFAKVNGKCKKINPNFVAMMQFMNAMMAQKWSRIKLWKARGKGFVTRKPLTSEQIKRVGDKINKTRADAKEKIIEERQKQYDSINKKTQEKIEKINETQDKIVKQYIKKQNGGSQQDRI